MTSVETHLRTTDQSTDRVVLPLLLACDEYEGDNEIEPLDRVRMQKGVFLMIQNGIERWKGLYTFRPYDWGPYSGALAKDIRELSEDGRLSANDPPPRRYDAYRTTAWGKRLLEDAPLTETEEQFVKDVRAFVTTRSFTSLLNSVYAAFPDMAVNSRYKPGR